MCNSIHSSEVEWLEGKEKEGIGWKLFLVDRPSPVNPQTFYKPLINDRIKRYYSKDSTRIATYEEKDNLHDVLGRRYFPEDGFCFFFNKIEAEKSLEYWIESFPKSLIYDRSNISIEKIYYYDGICRQIERSFTSFPITIGLCKSFGIIKRYGSFGGVKSINFVKLVR